MNISFQLPVVESSGQGMCGFVSPDRAFGREYFNNAIGTPSNPAAVEDEETVWHYIPRAPVAEPDEPSSVPTTRQVVLHKSYVERVGYSADCPTCRMLVRGEVAGPSRTPQCRKRIEEEMADNAILKQRLEAATERKERRLASEVERGSTQAREGEAPSGTQTAEGKTRQEEVIDRGPEEDGIPEVGEEDADGVE